MNESLELALRWLARASNSKSPSMAQEHATVLLEEYAALRSLRQKLAECDAERDTFGEGFARMQVRANEAERQLALVTEALADLFDYTKEMERLLRPLGRSNGVELPNGAELGARVGRLIG